MNTHRLAGLIGLLAVVTLGVIGIDRWTKDAKARQKISPTQAAASETKQALPFAPSSTIHFQVDPQETPLPPIVLPMENEPPALPPTVSPKESEPPPLISTGELEKQLKESIDNLQKVLPKLPGGEESATLPPPEPAKASEPEKKAPPPADEKLSVPPAPPPPLTNVEVPLNPNVGPAPVAPPLPAPPTEPEARKPLDPPANVSQLTPLTGGVRNAAAIASQDDLQKRLADLEIRYLKDMVAEFDRRMQQMPMGELRRKTALDHQRYSDRLARMLKAAEMVVTHRVEQAGGIKDGITDSPWTMHLEAVDGKTVLQVVVHRKARFKIVCDRLDLQAPRGTMLAVGSVQLSGEGFQGACDRLSIPLHDDRLILEGNAEVGIRTQPLALIDESREGLPPLVDPRRLDERSSSAVPILHLKGDHLDLRWSDMQSGIPGSTRSDAPHKATIRATPGPMVKVAFNSAAEAQERWSEWGTLQMTAQKKDGRPVYIVADRQGKPLAFVHTPAGMSLAEYVGKRISVFGLQNSTDERYGQELRADGRPVPTFTASHVAWE